MDGECILNGDLLAFYKESLVSEIRLHDVDPGLIRDWLGLEANEPEAGITYTIDSRAITEFGKWSVPPWEGFDQLSPEYEWLVNIN